MASIHLIERDLHVISVDPNEKPRKESATFREAKRRLKQDGHMKCYMCGATENLQVHHRAAEYQYGRIVDFALLKEFCEEWDIYGYGRLLKAQPITTVDDVRNQMVLCQGQHTGVDHTDGNMGTGIHDMDFPTFIIQKLAKPGMNPVPQNGETAEQVLERIEASLAKEAPQA